MINFNVKLFKNLSKDEIKRLKQLCVKSTGEKLIVFPDHYVIFSTYGMSKKIVAMCCTHHFHQSFILIMKHYLIYHIYIIT